MHKAFAPVKAVLLSVLLIFVTASHLQATESVTFSGGGYSVDILVGRDDKPSVARVLFSSPGDTSLEVVPHELLRIEKFDDDKRVLIIHFVNKGEPKLPKAFSLAVRKNSGVLTVDGKRIKGSFDWLDEIP
jgi:hypothetical protein